MPRRPLAAILLAAALPAAIGARDRPVPVPVATPTGPAKACIPIGDIDRTIVRDDRTIDFVMRGGHRYRVTLPKRCPQLGFEQRFGFDTSLTQLCATDIITVLSTSPPVNGASCGLAPFQPIAPAER